MADFIRNILGGGAKSSEAPPVASPDSDFADFAEAPSPAPEAPPAGATTVQPAASSAAAAAAAAPAATLPPYTHWYNVHERHSLSEFKSEGLILAVSCVIFLLHILGTRSNRSRARKWVRAHAPVLKKEYALVGFGGVPNSDSDESPDKLLREKSLFEFATYATGRQNTAFTDVKLTLAKRFNPFVNAFENVIGFFMDAVPMPEDSMEALIYPFDGRESLTVPALPGAAEVRGKDPKSTFDGFVWAIVNKEGMRQARDDRFDLSLTFTKDNPKLPNWLTVMSESAEITDNLLTPELVDAIKSAGDLFDYLIISDQPVDKPQTLEEISPRKRLYLKYRLPSNGNYDNFLPLFSYFLRLPDILVKVAHFRPEVLKKVRSTRDGVSAVLKKAAEDEKNEERQIEREKIKKAKRDAELKALDAKAQKRYLEKEKEKEQRKAQKKQSVRG